MHTDGTGPRAAPPAPYSLANHLDAARQLSGGEAVASIAEAFHAGHLQLTEQIELPGGWRVGPADKKDRGIIKVILPEDQGGFAVFHKDHPLAQRATKVHYTQHSDKVPPEQQFPTYASPLAETLAPQVPLREITNPEALKGYEK